MDINTHFVLSGEEYIKQLGMDAPMTLMFNVDDDREGDIYSFLENHCENINMDLKYESQKSFMKEFESLKNIF